MITEDYVSFETAKLLKKKGFDEPCLMCYTYDGKLGNYGQYNSHKNSEVFSLTAPTLQMAMKWLRKIYSLEIYPYHDFPKVGDKWWFEIIKYPNYSVSEYESETAYNTYEETVEAGIKYCLENLI